MPNLNYLEGRKSNKNCWAAKELRGHILQKLMVKNDFLYNILSTLNWAFYTNLSKKSEK